MNMRSLSWLFVMAMSVAAEQCHAQDTMRWQPNLEAAQRLAAQTNRLVLIHFCGSGCQPCARMDAEVFNLPTTGQSLSANFIAVKISRDESPQTTQMFNVRRIPTDMIVTPDNRVIARFEGFQPADQYVKNLNQAADDYRRASHAAAGYPTGAAGTTVATRGGPLVATQPVAGNSPTYEQPPTQTAYSSERYAEYLNRNRSVASTNGSVPTSVAAGAPAGAAPAYSSAAEQSALASGAQARPQEWAPSNAAAPVATPGANYGAGNANVRRGAPQQDQPATYVTGATMPGAAPQNDREASSPPADPRYAAGAAPAPYIRQPSQPPAPQLPPGSPPLAVDGYCCVTLIDAHLHKSGKAPWQLGNPQWGAIHNGRTYLFVGPDEQKKFLANPNAYAPAMDGNDPVAALDQSQTIAGNRRYGLTYQNRIYLFSSEDNLQRFVRNQSRYAADVVQARR